MHHRNSGLAVLCEPSGLVLLVNVFQKQLKFHGGGSHGDKCHVNANKNKIKTQSEKTPLITLNWLIKRKERT